MRKEDELEKLMQEYDETFEGFPSFALLDRGKDVCIAIIKNCLRQKKDVYELGYLTLDDDTLY